MSQSRRTFQFDALETRELLSVAHAPRWHHPHHPRVHARPTIAAATLVLDGTLTVNNRGANSVPNLAGGMTNSVPVSGQLGSLGQVRGTWYESSDSFGNYVGPDTLVLHAAHGGFTVSFNNAAPGPAHPSGHGTVYYQHPQRAGSGTGAFAGAREIGTIDLNMNHGHTTVVSLTLSTKGT